MKVTFALAVTVALIAFNEARAQEAAAQPEVSPPIQEPSGTDPAAAPPTPAVPTPGQPTSVTDTNQTAAGTNSTITVSQTFTNDPNTITIVGTVSSEQEKQAVEMRLQEVLPGKQINNHLTVSSQQGIVEPAGAEKRDFDIQSDDENDLDDSELEDSQSDVPLNPELDNQK